MCSACTQVTTSLLRAAIYWLHHARVTQMRPFYHVPCEAFASNWLAPPVWVPGWSAYLAGLLTILGERNKPFRGVSKIVTDRLRQFTEISSILRHLFTTGRPSCTKVT